MAEPMDPGTLAKWKYVLRHGRSDSYVFINARSQQWLRNNLVGGRTPRWFVGYLSKEVEAGRAEPKRVRERGNAEDYPNEFHDDLVVTFDGRRIYVETVFHEDKHQEGCRIDIVNVHDAR
jgi:hypothetical protein